MTRLEGSAKTDDVNRDDQYYLLRGAPRPGLLKTAVFGLVGCLLFTVAGCGGGAKHWTPEKTAECFLQQGTPADVTSATGDLRRLSNGLPVGSGGDVSVHFAGGGAGFIAYVRDADEATTLISELRAAGATDADYGQHGNVVYWSTGNVLATNPEQLTGCLS